MRRLLGLVAAVVLAVGGTDVARAGTLFGSEVFGDQLLTINTSTGAATVIGGAGLSNVEGLAFDANSNTLYGTAFNQLLTIDKSTGVTTLVGPLGFTLFRGLAFDTNNNILYGTTSNQLARIDTSIAAFTIFAPMINGFPANNVEGLAYDPNSNILYGTDTGSGQLLTISTSTGQATLVGPLGFSLVRGLTFDPISNVLYGSEENSRQLLTINTSTGAATPVGPFNIPGIASPGVRGLAFDALAVPEPVSLVFLAMTAVCLAGYGWRHKRQVA